MSAALVSLGSVAAGSSSVAPAFGQPTAAGNLLVAWVVGNNAFNIAVTESGPSGWSVAMSIAPSSGNGSYVFFKPNCAAGETAPSFVDSGATFMEAQLAEFSGLATASPVDNTGSASSTSSGFSALYSGVDQDVGELLVSCSYAIYTGNAVRTISDSYNNGTAIVAGSNSGANSKNLWKFAYCFTTSNSGAVTDTVTVTTGGFLTRASVAGATFLLAPAAATPSVVVAPSQAAQRAASW